MKIPLGWRLYGLGVMALAGVCLAWGDFDQGQPFPKAFPGRAVLTYAIAILMLAGGGAVQWRRTAAWGAGVLTVYYAFVVVLLLNGRVMLTHSTVYGAYSQTAEQLAITAGALIVFAGVAGIEAALASRLTRVGQMAFGICALLFGGAHFVYLNLTAPLIPKWLPPGPTFWAYATGCAHIAAGIAILTGVRARAAAILLTIMYAAFTLIVHTPMLLNDPSSHTNWSESAEDLALIGAAWVVAISLMRSRYKPDSAHAESNHGAATL